MDVHKGMLVKTLDGRIVKLEKEEAPGSGYWQADDGHIHLAAAFREVSDDERKLYSISHGDRP
jgi:hypothetical protein